MKVHVAYLLTAFGSVNTAKNPASMLHLHVILSPLVSRISHSSFDHVSVQNSVQNNIAAHYLEVAYTMRRKM